MMNSGYKILLIVCIMLAFTVGCASKEGKKFLTSKETKQFIENNITEELERDGIALGRINKIKYRSIPKSTKVREDKIVATFETKAKPVVRKNVTFDVDIHQNPRVIKPIQIEDFDSDIYDSMMHHIYPIAHDASFKKVKKIYKHIKNMRHRKIRYADNSYGIPISLKSTDEAFRQSKTASLLTDFTEGIFYKPSVAEAKQLLKQYYKPETDDQPIANVRIEFYYDGVLTNAILKQLVQTLTTIQGLENMKIEVQVIGKQFEDDDSGYYDSRTFGDEDIKLSKSFNT